MTRSLASLVLAAGLAGTEPPPPAPEPPPIQCGALIAGLSDSPPDGKEHWCKLPHTHIGPTRPGPAGTHVCSHGHERDYGHLGPRFKP